MQNYNVEITRAARFVKEMERQIRSLKKYFLRCPVIPEASELRREYRHMLYGAYRTISKVGTKSVIIIRVIHGARLLDLSVFS